MRMSGRSKGVAGGALILALALGWWACSGEPETDSTPPVHPKPAPAAPAPEAPKAPAGPLPTLIVVQAQFVNMKPGPARMTLYRTDGKSWFPEVIEDPDSNVFHKALPWKDGILTIGGMKADLKFWKRGEDGQWTGTKLWEKDWGGKFSRMRDLEIGDVDGDGKDEMVIATHDMGVVAVGDEDVAEDGTPKGTWTFQEMDRTPDTFVHEVEIGDVDGDKKKEFYVTPSERNKASGVSQPGGVAQYSWDGNRYVRKQLVQWTDSHAKEILVADLDGDGTDELYAAKEGVVVKGADGKPSLKVPEQIIQLVPGAGGKWDQKVVATMDGEKQCRFLVAADVNHDHKKDIVAAGMDTGLWYLDRRSDGTFTPVLIDGTTGGFEHATDVADFDYDGKVEIYSASEKPGARMLQKFYWTGDKWEITKIDDIPTGRITWSLADGKL
jgi:hypothetical protein